MNSNFLNLNLKDFAKGLLLAVITAVLTSVYEVASTGDFSSIDWKVVLSVAGAATLSYLVKNLLTNSDGEPVKTEKGT